MSASPPLPTARQHVDALVHVLLSLDEQLDQAEDWGRRLAQVLIGGGRLLACGNGGSAADSQHLTAELVGRYRDDRRPLSAIALAAETSSVTAISNDYGYDEVFARQVHAHGQPGDVLLAISTSGRSANVVNAATVARQRGLHAWALTGPAPNPLAEAAHEAIAVDAPATSTIQEVHGVLVHAICAAVDQVVLSAPAREEPEPRVVDVTDDPGDLAGVRRIRPNLWVLGGGPSAPPVGGDT